MDNVYLASLTDFHPFIFLCARRYGFVPQTLCLDGDPLDVLVLSESALEPGTSLLFFVRLLS